MLLGLVLLGPGAARADQPAGPGEGEAEALPAFRVSVDLVQVDAVVTDKKGRLVTDLGPADFTILEGGKRQQIAQASFVSADAPAPPAADQARQPRRAHRTIVLVFDDLGLSFFGAAAAQSALERFAREPFVPGDHVAIVRTGQQEMCYTFLGNNEELSSAVAKLGYNLSSSRPGRGLGAAFERDTYARRVAILLGTIDGLRWLPGRKAVVLLSEGFYVDSDVWSGHGLHTAYDTLFSDNDFQAAARTVAEVANRASVVLYAVHAGGVGADWLSQATLHDLVDPTGGFVVVNHNDLHAALDRIVVDQAGYYLIGYEPRSSTFEKKSGKPQFRRVKVKVQRAGLTVRSRRGFYGLTDAEVAARAPRPIASK